MLEVRDRSLLRPSNLLVVVARRNQAPEVCRNLGLEDKLTDIVKKMISSGKQIEVVNFVHTFGLTEKYPPVPLLKAYLNDAKKLSQDTAKSGNNSINAQNDGASKEIAAVKAIIKCIQEHKLELQMSPEDFQKHVAHLEKVKADRKRSAVEAVKSQIKRPHISNGSGPAPSTAERISTVYTSNIAADGEALAVNFAFQLHQMPDESVSTSNHRDRLIQMVRRLNPNVVTVRVLRFEKSFSLNFVSLYSKKR